MVAEAHSNPPGPFDVDTVKSLVRLMRRHDLTEIELRDGAQRILLRRGGQAGAVPVTTLVAPPPPVAAGGPKPVAEAPAANKNLLEIKSPMVGTFYARPKPEAAVFVSEGSRVTPTTVVCVIEAMKTFNEVTADCSGVIRKILVDNQQFVEFNQVLFLVDPTG